MVVVEEAVQIDRILVVPTVVLVVCAGTTVVDVVELDEVEEVDVVGTVDVVDSGRVVEDGAGVVVLEGAGMAMDDVVVVTWAWPLVATTASKAIEAVTTRITASALPLISPPRRHAGIANSRTLRLAACPMLAPPCVSLHADAADENARPPTGWQAAVRLDVRPSQVTVRCTTPRG